MFKLEMYPSGWTRVEIKSNKYPKIYSSSLKLAILSSYTSAIFIKHQVITSICCKNKQHFGKYSTPQNINETFFTDAIMEDITTCNNCLISLFDSFNA